MGLTPGGNHFPRHSNPSSSSTTRGSPIAFVPWWRSLSTEPTRICIQHQQLSSLYFKPRTRTRTYPSWMTAYRYGRSRTCSHVGTVPTPSASSSSALSFSNTRVFVFRWCRIAVVELAALCEPAILETNER